MPDKDPKDFGALLEGLRQHPRSSDPRVKAVLDEAFPRLETLHHQGNDVELVRAIQAIQQKVDEILAPVPAGAAIGPGGSPPTTEPPATEPPECPDPDVPELDNTIKESFDGMSNAEIVYHLLEQYRQRLVTLQYFNIIADTGTPFITDINGVAQRAPKFSEIQPKLLTPEFLEKTKRLKKPMLLVTPIGMSLKTLAEKVGGKRGRLAKHKPVSTSWDLDADKTGDLVYFPERYDKDNHGGITKTDLLAQSGGKNMFPGWQVTVVEGDREIDLEAIKIKPPPTDPNAPKYKNAHQFLQEMKTGGISGLMPEEWLVLHTEGVRRGEPFESQYWTRLLAAYHKALGAVPDSRFRPGVAVVRMGYVPPGSSGDVLRVRRAARG